MRLQRSRTRPQVKKQISKPRIGTEEDVEDYCTQDSTSTSLVSSSTHAQQKEEDSVHEGVEVGGNG
jgi:hypothetical protein